MTSETPRWVYRFDNYRKAVALLREAVDAMQAGRLTQLEKEGAIQRFEFTWELAWKVLKDYLENQGVVLDSITPATVVRASFAAKVIDDGDAWMNILTSRNQMSHVYDFSKFELILEDVRQKHLARFESLASFLETRKSKE